MTKLTAFLLLFICSSTATAQQKLITQGYLEYNVKYSSASVFDMPPPPPPPPPVPGASTDSVFQYRSAEDGINIKFWFKSGKERVVNDQYGRTTFLFNTAKDSIITLREINGTRTGTVATGKEQEDMNRYMDSLMAVKPELVNLRNTWEANESRNILGLECKKIIMISENQYAKADTTIVWYYPGYKLPNDFIFITENLKYRTKLKLLNEVPGLPVKIEISVSPKINAVIELKKISIEKQIADKEFIVPKDFILKPLKEQHGMQ
jgi:hypothetical protein